MDAKEFLTSKVVTENFCSSCNLSVCCAFPPLFEQFLTLKAIVWDEKGCPRDWDYEGALPFPNPSTPSASVSP